MLPTMQNIWSKNNLDIPILMFLISSLLLFSHTNSIYLCLQVVFALNEKKIKYKSRIVDLYQGEQFEPGFIKLNPKSEVPVLQDGVKIIPDSRRIIDYLEDNFSNGECIVGILCYNMYESKSLFKWLEFTNIMIWQKHLQFALWEPSDMWFGQIKLNSKRSS